MVVLLLVLLLYDNLLVQLLNDFWLLLLWLLESLELRLYPVFFARFQISQYL
jgi:hypothetical protein